MLFENGFIPERFTVESLHYLLVDYLWMEVEEKSPLSSVWFYIIYSRHYRKPEPAA